MDALRLAERLRQLPNSDSDPEVLALKSEIEKVRSNIEDQSKELHHQRYVELPTLEEDSNQICSKAFLLEGVANLLSGLFNILLAFALFYIGLMVAPQLPAPARNDEGD